ncbi:MAG: hypothetical protein V3S24_09165, partial [Candidatus Tectomicrobia bacterium]
YGYSIFECWQGRQHVGDGGASVKHRLWRAMFRDPTYIQQMVLVRVANDDCVRRRNVRQPPLNFVGVWLNG